MKPGIYRGAVLEDIAKTQIVRHWVKKIGVKGLFKSNKRHPSECLLLLLLKQAANCALESDVVPLSATTGIPDWVF
nr:hypothetical protein [Pedobacter panaciterrae]